MESRERTECSGSNEGRDNTLQSDEHHCEICHGIACDPVVTNRCCNQIFCSRCLKEYLEHIQDNHARPCPCCTKQHFTYVPLSMKVLSMDLIFEGQFKGFWKPGFLDVSKALYLSSIVSLYTV